MHYSHGEYVQLIKALADETRLSIIILLKDGHQNSNRLLEEHKITQSTLDYHMKILTDCGLVKRLEAGGWTFYSLNEQRYNDLIDIMKINKE